MVEQLNLSELVQVNFPENQYYREETQKTQIVLHHTVSSGNAGGSINWWLQSPDRIATHFIIDSSGCMFQLFSSKYWAHHLGVKKDFLQQLGFSDFANRNVILNKGSVGIEICRWGGLLKDVNGYHPTYWDATLKKEVCQTKVTIPNENVQVFTKPFRGYYAFEKYTPEQIESVGKLVTYLSEKWNIPLTYQSDMWDVSKNALGSMSSIYAHVSFREDKSDIFPMPEMIEMLQNLE